MPNLQYSQPPPNVQQLLPGYTPPPLPPIPQHPQHFQNATPPRPTVLPTQPVPNPNNKTTQPLHNIGMRNPPTCSFSHAPAYEIQLRSGKILNKNPRSSVVITKENEGEEEPMDEPMSDAILEDYAVPKTVTHPPPQKESTWMEKTAPFPE